MQAYIAKIIINVRKIYAREKIRDLKTWYIGWKLQMEYCVTNTWVCRIIHNGLFKWCIGKENTVFMLKEVDKLFWRIKSCSQAANVTRQTLMKLGWEILKNLTYSTHTRKFQSVNHESIHYCSALPPKKAIEKDFSVAINLKKNIELYQFITSVFSHWCIISYLSMIYDHYS